jgi:transcription elongation factor Elf1
MTKLTQKPEIMGTRTGYIIRFTCPLCAAENLIVNKTPRDHYKETRDASCSRCRKRSTVLTPNRPAGKPAATMASLVLTPPQAP